MNSYSEYVSNQAYVARNLIPVITNFEKSPMDEKLKSALKKIFELHTPEISGLRTGRVLTTDDAELTQLKYGVRHQPEICLNLREVFGKPIHVTLDAWCDYLGQKWPADLATNDLGLLLIEPDATHLRAIDAWHFEGIHPHEWGLDDQGRWINSTQELSPSLIPLRLLGKCRRGPDVLKLAQALMPDITSSQTPLPT